MVQIGISINHEENPASTNPTHTSGETLESPAHFFEKPTDRQDPDPENPTEGHPLVVPWAAFGHFVSFRFGAVSRVPGIGGIAARYVKSTIFFRNLWDAIICGISRKIF